MECLSRRCLGCSLPTLRIGLWSKSKMAVRTSFHMYYPFGLDPPDVDRWILIKPESSLFEELRRQHNQQGKWAAGLL